MRIARYVTGDQDPTYGAVELAVDQGQNPDTVHDFDGDPLAGPVHYVGEPRPLDEVRLLAPVIPRSKVVGVGRNYASQAAALGVEVPQVPVLFLKPNTAVIGPDDPIIKPASCAQLNFEAELAIVIGRICRAVPPERAKDVIFGYTGANDVTARDLQLAEDQWTRAKGWDTFCPLGPWIVTHLSIAEAQELELSASVDGQLRQSDTTASMVRGIAELVSFVSGFTTLLPGDVILTGTPAGNGPVEPGQRVSITIAQIGTLTNPVLAEADSVWQLDADRDDQ